MRALRWIALLLTLGGGIPGPSLEAGAAAAADEALGAAIAAGDYLLRVQDDEGRFRYYYDPAQPDATEPYNWLRHAGTGYALAQLHRVTGEKRFRVGARRAAEHLVGAIAPMEIGERTFQVVLTDFLPDSNTDRGKLVKTGGVALGVVALWAANETGDEPRHRDRMLALGEYLLHVQLPSGGFESYYLVQRRKFDTSVSEYYPGQALLALALLEQSAPDPRFRVAIARALADRVRLWAASPRQAGFDHWGLIGAGRALPILSDAELKEFVDRSRDEILAIIVAYAESELATQVSDGSFAAKTGSAPATGTRLEGLHAVGRLVRRPAPDPTRAAPEEIVAAVAGWEPAIRRGQHFLLSCPYTSEMAATLARGSVDITGGFRDLCRPGIAGALRIDNSQHGISGLIGERSPF